MRTEISRPGITRHMQALTLLVLCTIPWGAAWAVEVRFFRMQSGDAFLKGTLDGVGIDPLGTLRLADRAERVGEIGEPFVFAAAPHPEGWVVGTGNAGKVLLVDREGSVTELFSAEEPEVFAVWADEDGTVLAGSSPRGKVYRISNGEAEVLFEPQETYIWDLARARDGSLLVATGTEGRLYRVDSGGKGEVLFDSEDTHLRVLKVLGDGDILVGTAGEGWILRLSEDGTARTLHDAAEPEVVAFAADSEGNCYAAVLASEASLVDLARRRSAAQAGDESGAEKSENSGDPEVTVTVEEVEAPFTGSRPREFRGPRSTILRISAQGVVETLWRSAEETVYGLLWHRDRLWVGTGLEGKLYSLRDRQPVLEKDVDERQIVRLLEDRPGPAFVTTNAAALYRMVEGSERKGSYSSPALDAGATSRFGSLRWRGQQPPGSGIEFSFRSGMSSEPDRTWSAWSRPAKGEEIDLSAAPRGRYVQWRVDLQAAGDGTPSVSEVTLSYRQENLPPTIEKLEVMDPGQILVPANFNPGNQVYEPAHPNREGIFTSLQVADADAEDPRMKVLWKHGFRTLRWEAEDPNEDDLRFSLSFRAEGSSDDWLPMAENLEETHYSFDSTVLPDGVYRFRLQARDRQDGAIDEALLGESVTEPALIDHTPPRLSGIERSGDRLTVQVEDALTPLREASVSVDAKDWRELSATDGLLDSRRESLLVTADSESKLLLLRLMDAAFNVITYDLTGETK